MNPYTAVSIRACGISMVLTLTGCGTFQVFKGPTKSNYRPDTLVSADSKTVDGLVDFNNDGQILQNKKFQDALVAARATQNGRDAFIAAMMLASDRLVGEHLAKVSSGKSGVNYTLASATQLLAGLATIVTPVNTTRALAGAAGITTGVREAWNEHAYENILMAALLEQIETDRAAWRSRILQGMSLPIPKDGSPVSSNSAAAFQFSVNPDPVPPLTGNTYSIDQALIDLSNYHRVGSVAHAVSRLGKKDPTPTDPAARALSVAESIMKTIESLQKLKAGKPANDNFAKQVDLLIDRNLGLLEQITPPKKTDTQSEKTDSSTKNADTPPGNADTQPKKAEQ